MREPKPLTVEQINRERARFGGCRPWGIVSLILDLIATIDTLTDERDDYRARKDAAYEERNRVVALLASHYPSGIKKTDIPGWDAEWHGCVYIDLPCGQVSWHYHDSQAYLFARLPPYPGSWDGHTTEDKHSRIEAMAMSEEPAARDKRIAELEAEIAKLSDPSLVHINMLRGTIAKPSVAQILHVYQDLGRVVDAARGLNFQMESGQLTFSHEGLLSLADALAALSAPSGRAAETSGVSTPTAPREGTDSGRRGKLYDKTEDWDMRHTTQAVDLDEPEGFDTTLSNIDREGA